MSIKKKNLIIVPLGGANDNEKNLAFLSKQRLDKVIELKEIHKKKYDIKIVLSGGFGHFNVTNETHSKIQEKYLLDNGVLESFISYGNTNSFSKIEDTVDEAIALYNEINSFNSDFYKATKIIIVTSLYHLPRSKYLMETVCNKNKSNHFKELNVIGCDPIPLKSNLNDGGIDFINHKKTKKDFPNLWEKFMGTFSKRQMEALNKYEEISLTKLKENPYGKWLEFLNKI